MKRSSLPILVASMSLAMVAYAGQPPPGPASVGPLSDAELWTRYYEFLARVKPHGVPLDREEHEKVVKPTITARVKCDWFSNTERSVTIEGRDWISVELDELTGEVRRYEHHRALRDIGERERPKDLSEEEVAELASGYLSLHDKQALSEYSVTAKETQGYWYLCFKRKKDGYAFKYDAIYMKYAEGLGLLFYLNTVFSEECPTDVQLSGREATAMAQEFIQKHYPREAKIPLISRDEPYLIIINPRYMWAAWKTKDVPFRELRKTRLAYMLVYEGDPKAGLKMPVVVFIYVDAITGEVLYHVRVC